MANRNWASGGKIYSMFTQPVLIDLNFVVDSTNGNHLGIRNLKGPGVANVFMQANSAAPSPPPGSPNLASASTFAILASSTVTNTGFTVVNGNLGLYPGTSVTGFPPGVVSPPYVQHITDAAANQARIDATAAYTDISTRSATPISSTLDGQTLGAGVYSESSGTFNLAQSGDGTLTLNGSSTDIFIFQCSSTLTTGAGGIPTITLTGGALASNVYWAVGSSATINVGVTSAGAEFKGTIIAQASITDTQGGIVTGRLLAGISAGAVTLSAATTINLPSGAGPTPIAGTPAAGTIVVQLQDNYNRMLKGFKAIVSPVSGSPLKVDNSALTAGVAYIITTLGNSTAAQWHALGVPPGVVPAVGVSFIALSNGGSANVSSSRVMTAALAGSGILSIETVGDPNLSIAPDPTQNQGFGAQILLQTRDYAGNIVAPADGSVISLAFLLNNSGNTVQGE
jgi:hypothetical protein